MCYVLFILVFPIAKISQIGVQKAAISKHLKNIFDSGELDRRVTVSKMETVLKDLLVGKIDYFGKLSLFTLLLTM